MYWLWTNERNTFSWQGITLLTHFCRGGASLRCSNRATPEESSRCPEGSPPDAASSRSDSDKGSLVPYLCWSPVHAGTVEYAHLLGSKRTGGSTTKLDRLVSRLLLTKCDQIVKLIISELFKYMSLCFKKMYAVITEIMCSLGEKKKKPFFT